jgi:hypothetical protein
VDGIVGDCGGFQNGVGDGGCKADGYGEMSYAIGVYMGPEELSEDPIVTTVGVAPTRSLPGPPPRSRRSQATASRPRKQQNSNIENHTVSDIDVIGAGLLN